MPHQGQREGYSELVLFAFEGGLILTGALMVVTRQAGKIPRHHHGILLGSIAGLMFGVADVAIKALSEQSSLATIATSQ